MERILKPSMAQNMSMAFYCSPKTTVERVKILSWVPTAPTNVPPWPLILQVLYKNRRFFSRGGGDSFYVGSARTLVYMFVFSKWVVTYGPGCRTTGVTNAKQTPIFLGVELAIPVWWLVVFSAAKDWSLDWDAPPSNPEAFIFKRASPTFTVWRGSIPIW